MHAPLRFLLEYTPAYCTKWEEDVCKFIVLHYSDFYFRSKPVFQVEYGNTFCSTFRTFARPHVIIALLPGISVGKWQT